MRLLVFLVLVCGAVAISQIEEQKSTSPQPAANAATTTESFCPEAKTQLEMNQCLFAAYQRADNDLNQLYSQLAKKQSAESLTKLQAAQRAWIKYRDANCEAEASLYDGGSIVPATRSACLDRNTRARIAELHRIYDTGTR